MVETIRRNALRDGYFRIIVSREAVNLGLDPRRCPQASVIIIVEQFATDNSFLNMGRIFLYEGMSNAHHLHRM
ncbi:branched-chain amino acid aminotransferase/4-amino-4-deoxychorismate lyase [Paenibacillus popilliae ATCC 14706]|uniref:Branched-chain amino acid aminotransferase/4-amino-4-deoxychorismate lyase n=1 Tax=Paenibacillus popilliae ATCC 14706 TaxID=1212764 RepID=M9LYU9_PAEPP|nr:branched-chain amino acid aminotransferase/4-amino-4-deoxychorismate lyase [Paenibacillus popilliae ATCC 14706]